ncbi:sulfurtransferase [uncultured Cyclobacterium sp.]|mgnify:CR=1 FL=1|uniref:sulfurtransferase n=1 Tax=uncultured Cyclobacterium sp. TaxID=453820 RepID=UPI0030EC8B9F|tara:strand:- start:14314 stop:15156 length:843 start_codon:yes stop_codon:yes gene_type:complete
MNRLIQPLINVKELLQLASTQKLTLIDARYGYSDYEKEHLDGAIHVDLNKDLSNVGENPAQGGRHPLPSTSSFVDRLGRLGISPENHVIVYDDKSAAIAAARFWWMLRAVGHKKIQVLDGGFQAAKMLGFPTNDKRPTPQPLSTYPSNSWQLPVAELEEVSKASQQASQQIIDVREVERYKGIKEPIDKIAGHIPGAINLPFTENLDENGFFLPKTTLRDKYLKAFNGSPTDKIIVHCGSGVTACHTLLAISQAGLNLPKLYVGSWSEWSRNNLPIATEK